MADLPKAILLYSRDFECCSLEGHAKLISIYMSSWVETRATLSNMADNDGTLRAAITSNPNGITGHQDADDIANVVLVVGGFVTCCMVLFFTFKSKSRGQVRQHETYRQHQLYRPPQRSRGLARTILDTLPIIKFGQGLPKTDPAIELEAQTLRAEPGPAVGTGSPEEPRPSQSNKTNTPPTVSEHAEPESTPASDQPEPPVTDNAEEPASSTKPALPVSEVDSPEANPNALLCSLCIEDFQISNDVRVLPCEHKFHLACVEPWLINVSGTCPFW
ncbi:hypothetical protein N0V88_000515 [Collariella sp. IMI 366227]|nr:hypothetical protein N0V88_000515 [Collariella sp. IMI 366227]